MTDLAARLRTLADQIGIPHVVALLVEAADALTAAGGADAARGGAASSSSSEGRSGPEADASQHLPFRHLREKLELEQQLKVAAEEITRLREALQTYGWHLEDCAVRERHNVPLDQCTCGYAGVLDPRTEPV